MHRRYCPRSEQLLDSLTSLTSQRKFGRGVYLSSYSFSSFSCSSLLSGGSGSLFHHTAWGRRIRCSTAEIIPRIQTCEATRSLYSSLSLSTPLVSATMAGPRRTIDSYFRRKPPSTSTSTLSSSSSSSSSSRQEMPKTLSSGHLYYSQIHGSRRDPTQKAHSTASKKAVPYRGERSTTAVEQDEMDEDEMEPEPEHEDNDDNDRDRDNDPYDLSRFLSAQSSPPSYQGSYAAALSQLRRGRKTSHWVWYILPQMPLSRGGGVTGLSQMSRYYGIRSLAEARAYLEHAVLGARLREVTAVVARSPVADVEVLMGGETDAAKLLSCMTLFARAASRSGGGGSGGPSGGGRGGGRSDEVGTSSTVTKTAKDDGGNGEGLFKAVIDKYFAGETDSVTERALDDEEQQEG